MGQLRRSGADLDAATRDRLLAVIEQAGEQLLRLTEDLAVAAASSTGRVRMEIEPCDAREVAERIVDAARVAFGEATDITLVAPDELPPVAADPARLRQVLTNLVDNALRHGALGSPVTVSLEPTASSLRIAVADSGPGIPPDARERVFEPYASLGPGAGSGLGLWIARELAARMDGSVTVSPGDRGGSTFTVELPLA